MIVVVFVALRVYLDIVLENINKDKKDYMAEEFQFEDNRRVVLQGMFRKHNQAFRDNGFKPPKGTA